MKRTINECRLIGKNFERLVAAQLRSFGFDTWENLYVPYRPGDSRYTQIDILAIRDNVIIVVECKNVSGTLKGNFADKEWFWENHFGKGRFYNPVKQSYCHRKAVEAHLDCLVLDIVVLPNETVHLGDRCPCLKRVSELQRISDVTKYVSLVSAEQVNKCRKYLQDWSNPSDDIKRQHLLGINALRNDGIVQNIKAGVGMGLYCIMANNYYFYAFTDENGIPWLTDKVDNAWFSDDLSEVTAIADGIETSIICTLEMGGIEDISDLPDELDDVTPAEYAYEVGARPW